MSSKAAKILPRALTCYYAIVRIMSTASTTFKAATMSFSIEMMLKLIEILQNTFQCGEDEDTFLFCPSVCLLVAPFLQSHRKFQWRGEWTGNEWHRAKAIVLQLWAWYLSARPPTEAFTADKVVQQAIYIWKNEFLSNFMPASMCYNALYDIKLRHSVRVNHSLNVPCLL